MENMCEILAPAGNQEMLQAAVFSGADAVYLGLTSFNARRSAGNFSAEQLKQAVAFCHGRDVKVYVVLNTTVYTQELEGVKQAIQTIAQSGADAIIVQDLGVARMVRLFAPHIPLHGSTQLSVHSVEGAKQLKKMGFARVIPGRELTLEEIRTITENCEIEVECFIHGALCMSVSGQCMMSAFLGGRSGNRGSCAGPCRLPFSADNSGNAHLSLKDMSHIEYLPQLQQAGVCSIKIEGRMRTPEYVAAIVAACRSVREGKEFDKELVKGVFSRSGFTDGYIKGQRDASMFGVRTKQDAEQGKKILPKARELYRREFSRVLIDMTFTVQTEGAKLKCSDGTYTAIVYLDHEPQPAEKEQTASIQKALSKTGGTPFLVNKIVIENQHNLFLPANAINEARRTALAQLLEKRSKASPWDCNLQEIELPIHNIPNQKSLWIRLNAIEQLDFEQSDLFTTIILPISQAEKVPEFLRPKTFLELPRAMFGGVEQDTKAKIEVAREMGFAGFEVQNIAHLHMCQQDTLLAGFGLNITNQMAAVQLQEMGVQAITLLPELSAEQMQQIKVDIPTGAISYGHLPLMLTRACPIKNVRSCLKCPKRGELTDRKNKQFPVRCGLGVRTIFNPIPLYLGDKPKALPCDYEMLYFSIESPVRVKEVVELYTSKKPFDTEFTRGLYFKGTE